MAVVSVFVSSTFRDFHAERDELVASVLPVLNERVAEYGCRVEVIDLRWGVAAADDDERHARVLEVCLNEIERARPLFVGLLGDRYGWVPDEVLLANAVREAGSSAYNRGMSATALEFEHGALLRPFGESVFLEREIVGPVPRGWQDDDTGPVRELKSRVREHCEVHRYQLICDGDRPGSLEEFVAVAVRAIGEKVVRRAREIAESQADPVAAAEALFFEDRLRAFDGRADVVTAVVDTIRAGHGVCLTGESGAGKSAVWCAAVQELAASGARVVAVPVGASPDVATVRAMLLRACAILGVDVPPSLAIDELEHYTQETLRAAGPVVFAVDGLDQLPGHGRPTFIAGLPAGVTALVSTTVSEQAHYAAAVGLSTIEIAALASDNGRAAVGALCSALGRTLPPAAIEHLVAEPCTPLWLRLAVGELSALDAEDFASVDPNGDPLEEIARLVTATVAQLPVSTGGLISRIIGRAGERFGSHDVDQVVALAALSRSGLRHNDFEEITGLNALTVAGIRRALSGLLTLRGGDGRLGFAHSVVRRYVTDRVAFDESRLHRLLAAHFTKYEDDPLCQEDRLWHLFRDRGASVAPILNHIPDDQTKGLTTVVLESLSVPGLDESLRGLDASGVAFLAQTVLDCKDAMRTADRIALSISTFRAARIIAGDQELDEMALRAVSNAACCLADLPSAVGHDLTEAAEEAFAFTEDLVVRYPDSMPAHEANAQIAMWFASEIPGDENRALAASRTAAREWQWSYARESSFRVKSWLQFALIRCGAAELRAGNTSAARSLYEQALQLTREIHQMRGSPAGQNINIINALVGLGNTADAEGDAEGVLRNLGEAATLAQEDYAEDPTRRSTEQLAQVSRIYGIALSKTEYQTQSHEWLLFSDSLFQYHLRADPENSQWVFAMDVAARAATAEILLERPRDAAARIQRALSNASDADTACSIVAQSLIDGARRVAQADNHRASIAICNETVRLLADTNATSGHWNVLLADALSVQAHAHLQLGQPDLAAESLRSSISARKRYLSDPTARDQTLQARACGVSLVELAYLGDEEQRISVTHELVEHWSRHLPDDKGEGGHSNQWLARHLATLAVTSPGDASALIAVAWRYARHLVDSEPDNHGYLAGLAGVVDIAGVAAAKTGQLEVAAQAWQNAASILGTVETTDDQVIAMRRSIAANLHRVSREPTLTSEVSSRCLAAAVILLRLNGSDDLI